MASIIDSFRETATDKLVFLKLAVMAAPLFFSYELLIKGNFLGYAWLFNITVFLLYGVLIKTTSGVLNEKDTVLPSLNPIPLAIAAVKGSLATAPVAWLCSIIALYLCSVINFVPWLDITLESIIWLLAVSIPMTSFLMFVRRERIGDAYYLKTLSDKTADLMVGLIFFVIQLIIINIPTTVLIGYIILVLFGYGPVFNFTVALIIVFNIGVAGHYLAQLQYEILGYDKENFS